MNKLSIILLVSLLAAVLLLSGCSKEEASTGTKTTTTSSKTATNTATKTTTSYTPATSTRTDSTATRTTAEGREVEDTRYYDTTDGDQVGLSKLESTTRDKTATEKCVMSSPISCVKYLASDGIVYLTLKNTGYGSKISEVYLTLNGEACDPSNIFIEPGQIKQFTCYYDSSQDFVSGPLELEYYHNMDELHVTKTGTLYVLTE